ncbi:MAG: FAD-dependent oxidoreductase [Burkholderiaceae bacterium]|nr:FAD-dependent oxidoreductase [Burkholderiaceae bacterium]
MSTPTRVDAVVVGGGVVGTAIAYGLAKAGDHVVLLDEGDDAYRAARGNFGLVWVQGKGLGNPDYARWTLRAAAAWQAFGQELADETGVDVELQQVGGLTMCLDDTELASSAAKFASLREAMGGDYAYDILDGDAVRRLLPHTGPDVVGAVYCDRDGHVSPLRLLRALLQAFTQRGGHLVAGARVEHIRAQGGGFDISLLDGRMFSAQRVVLAAGLGNRELAPQVGLCAPVLPNRGQILVSERVQPFLTHPTLYVRQTGEGVVQIGDSKEDVGLDDGTTLDQLSRIARRAVRCFPLLSQVNVVRTWGALRVMSPDGFPIYQQSSSQPGAYVVTCHSGITLAALHAHVLTPWLRGGAEPPDIQAFKAERFDHV